MNSIFSLIKMELRKLFSLRNSLIFIALLLLKVVIWNMTPYTEYDFSKEVYGKYIDEISGEMTADTDTFIEKEERRFDELFSKQEEIERKYNNDEITLDEYSDFNFKLVKAQNELPAFNEIMLKYEYFKAISSDSKSPIFFYDLDISEYLSSLKIDYLFVVFLVFVIMFLLAQDKDSNMNEMIAPTIKGRGYLINVRLISSLIFTLIFGVMSACGEFVLFLNENGTSYLNMKLYSIEKFGSCDYNLTVFQYIIAVYGMRIFWSLVLVAIVFLTYKFVKNNISSIFIVFTITFIPLLFDSMIKGGCRNALMGIQLSGVSVLENSVHMSLLAGIVTFLIALALMNYAPSKRIRNR